MSESRTIDLDRLVEAHTVYLRDTSVHYDEVLLEVADRARGTGSIGKADIGALLFWKRLRADTPWVRDLHNCPDSVVRTATAVMFAAANNLEVSVPEAAGAARKALIGLPGCANGSALPSALIVAAAPNRMAVYDKRAAKALGLLGIAHDTSNGKYRGYMQVIEDLRQRLQEREIDWTARDVDVALFQMGA